MAAAVVGRGVELPSGAVIRGGIASTANLASLGLFCPTPGGTVSGRRRVLQSHIESPRRRAGHCLPPCQAARRCHMCEAVYVAVREEVCMADATPERDGSEDEMKRKFREALEPQRAKQADGNAGRGGQPPRKGHA